MPTLTITRRTKSETDNLITIPRQEYEALLSYRVRTVKEVPLTVVQKKALLRARKNLARGKSLTLDELKRKLGIKG